MIPSRIVETLVVALKIRSKEPRDEQNLTDGALTAAMSRDFPHLSPYKTWRFFFWETGNWLVSTSLTNPHFSHDKHQNSTACALRSWGAPRRKINSMSLSLPEQVKVVRWQIIHISLIRREVTSRLATDCACPISRPLPRPSLGMSGHVAGQNGLVAKRQWIDRAEIAATLQC